MCAASFPANEQSPKTIVPGVGALNDPASRLPAHSTDEGLLAAPANVWANTAQANRGSHVWIVVTLVETEVFRSPRPTRATHDNGVEHFADYASVRNVCPCDDRCDGHAAPVGQNVPFNPAFCAVRRIWPREVPPFGAFTEALSNELHFSAAPRRP